jgi:hypothetical protein
LPLPIAEHLAASELAFVAVDGKVFLDLGDQRGVTEADAIANGWTEHVDVVAAIDR